MKIVLNKCFGGFSLSDFAVEALGLNSAYAYIERTNSQLISLIEQYGAEKVNGRHSELEIVNVPDNTTDWEMSDYDGFESIIYVVDGKIHHI